MKAKEVPDAAFSDWAGGPSADNQEAAFKGMSSNIGGHYDPINPSASNNHGGEDKGGKNWFRRQWDKLFGSKSSVNTEEAEYNGNPDEPDKVGEIFDTVSEFAAPIATTSGIFKDSAEHVGTSISTIQAFERGAAQEAIATSKVFKIAAPVARVASVLSFSSSGYKLVTNPTWGNATRVGVQGAILAIEWGLNSLLPGSGFVAGLILGGIEQRFGEELYRKIDE